MPPPYQPVGRCIYCGAERYSRERMRLGDEHIIPEGLGGTIVLPEASCAACERYINKHIEQPLMRGHFRNFRYGAGFRSKKNREKRRSSVAPVRLMTQYGTLTIQMDRGPYTLVLKEYLRPGYCDGDATPGRHTRPPQDFRSYLFHNPGSKARAQRVGATGVAAEWLPETTDKFALLLAKIGHAYATAAGALRDGYASTLADVLCGIPTPYPASFWVGGVNGFLPAADPRPRRMALASKGEHRLEMYVVEYPRHSLKVARLQLFKDLPDAPEYAIIVGLREKPGSEFQG